MLDKLAAKTVTIPDAVPVDTTATGKEYRYSRLTLRTVLADMRFEAAAPKPGDAAPAFDLPTTESARISSRNLRETGPVLIVFGSLTCPMTDSAVSGLREQHRRHAKDVRFVLVNVREAHPGRALPQPQNPAEKLARARELRRLHALPFNVAIDDLDGTFHRAMSAKPNSAFLIGRDGRIAFRAHWANDTAALACALQEIASGRPPHAQRSGGLLLPMLRMLPYLAPVLDRAGPGAWADMWRVMSPLAALAMASRMLGFSRRATRELSRRGKGP